MKSLADKTNTPAEDLTDLGAASHETKGGSMVDDFDGAVYQKRPMSGLSND